MTTQPSACTKTEGDTELPRENTRPASQKDISSGPLAIAGSLISLFSTNNRQRSPPNENKTCHVRLITIGVSHFCEKSRWVMDMVEASPDNPYYYTEDPHCPGFHSFASLPSSNYKASQTPMVLIKPAKTQAQQQDLMISGSTAVNQFFLPQLYPAQADADAIRQFEEELGQRLGATSRCFAYHHILGQWKTPGHTMITNVCANANIVSKVERQLFDKMLDKGLAKGILRAMKITSDLATTSEEELRKLFAEISQRLEVSGGQYLMDEKGQPSHGFTAADLTFAALSGPIILPPELDSIYPPAVTKQYPEAFWVLANELRATTAGKHVLKMYKKHRIPDGVDQDKVALKAVNRDCYPWEGRLGMVLLAASVAAGAAAVIAARVLKGRAR